MKVAGKVVVVRQIVSGREQIRVGIMNQGQVPLTLTNNVLHAHESPGLVVHDDVNWDGRNINNFGHGLPVAPNNASEQAFPLGHAYRGHPINDTSTLRLGFRKVGNIGAYATVPIKELKLNEPKLIDVRDDFIWYDNVPSAAGSNASPDSYSGLTESRYLDARNPLTINQKSTTDWVSQFLAPKVEPKYKCRGELTIEPVLTNGAVSGWMVRTLNQGKPEEGYKPFIATVALDIAEDGKKGLESMAVPHFQSEAAQAMFMGSKQYAQLPTVGTKVRLGVRGLGSETVFLPGPNEKVTVRVDRLPVNSNQVADEFFDLDSVLKKREEKAQIVRFSDGGVPVPVPPPPVYRGLLAIRESDFDAPEFKVQGLEATAERPRGWEISVRSMMPAQAFGKDVGFISTLQMQAKPGAVATDARRPVGKDIHVAPPKAFAKPGTAHTWFLPEGVDMNGVPVQAGNNVQFGTRGLGWFAIVGLPDIGKTVSSLEDTELMRFRPDQVDRNALNAADITAWENERVQRAAAAAERAAAAAAKK